MDYMKIFSVMSSLFSSLKKAGEDGVIDVNDIIDIIQAIIQALGWNATVAQSRDIDGGMSMTFWKE